MTQPAFSTEMLKPLTKVAYVYDLNSQLGLELSEVVLFLKMFV